MNPNMLNYQAFVLATVETRCYLDLAISSSRLVAKGQKHIQVFNLENGDDSLMDVFNNN